MGGRQKQQQQQQQQGWRWSSSLSGGFEWDPEGCVQPLVQEAEHQHWGDEQCKRAQECMVAQSRECQDSSRARAARRRRPRVAPVICGSPGPRSRSWRTSRGQSLTTSSLGWIRDHVESHLRGKEEWREYFYQGCHEKKQTRSKVVKTDLVTTSDELAAEDATGVHEALVIKANLQTSKKSSTDILEKYIVRNQGLHQICSPIKKWHPGKQHKKIVAYQTTNLQHHSQPLAQSKVLILIERCATISTMHLIMPNWQLHSKNHETLRTGIQH